MLLWNVRSLNKKVDYIMQHIVDTDVTIACITESWLTDPSNHVTYRIKNYGYSISHTHRENGMGGGVCFIYKPGFSIKQKKYKSTFESFEYHCVTISSGDNNPNLVVVGLYRKQEIAFTQFTSDFLYFCEKMVEQSTEYFLFLGDFNVHFENSYYMSNRLMNLSTSYGFSQCVTSATHIDGHMLDLIFSNTYEVPIHSINVDKYVTEIVSPKFDHYSITFFAEFKCSLEKVKYVEKTVRNIKAINMDSFNESCERLLHNDVSNAMHDNNFEGTISVLNTTLKNILDDYAPPRTKVYKLNSNHLPIRWMDDEYRLARNKRRRLERAFKNHPVAENKAQFLHQKNECARMAKRKMSSIISSKITEQKENGNLFKVLNEVLDNDNLKVLPSYSNATNLANNFNHFYLTKIENIRESIPYCTHSYICDSTNNVPFLYEFAPTTVDNVHTILKNMGRIKTSPHDPLPAKLLSDCINCILPTIVDVINMSLREGSIEGLKHSVVTPIYKKNNLDTDQLNSFRPIFNISFISKLIEKVVLQQFADHIRGTPYDSPHQHGYKKFHSTETMLLEMYDEALLGFENDFCTVLVMIDMSAAFDTVDIDILLKVLQNDLNVRGIALSWFRSFLKNRSQCVKIENSYSNTCESKYGVPPGSTLGPILFNVYSKGLSDVIRKSGFKTSSYADDSNGRLQFMINMQYSSLTLNVPFLLNNVQSYMNKYFLKMNSDKTEIMLLHPKTYSGKVIQGTFLNRNCFRFKQDCKYLGFYIRLILKNK